MAVSRRGNAVVVSLTDDHGNRRVDVDDGQEDGHVGGPVYIVVCDDDGGLGGKAEAEAGTDVAKGHGDVRSPFRDSQGQGAA